MLKIKISLVLAVAACVFAAVAAPALAAKEFQAKDAPVNLKDINKGGHVFETGGLGIVECETAESGGRAQTKVAQQIKVPVKYSKCFLKALGGFVKGAATVSEAKYNFFASGKVENENEILIEAKDGTETCKIKVPTTGNESLGTVSFTNVVSSVVEVEVKAAVTGITQVTEGGGNCGKSSKEGKYKGTSIEKAEKGGVAAS